MELSAYFYYFVIIAFELTIIAFISKLRKTKDKGRKELISMLFAISIIITIGTIFTLIFINGSIYLDYFFIVAFEMGVTIYIANMRRKRAKGKKEVLSMLLAICAIITLATIFTIFFIE